MRAQPDGGRAGVEPRLPARGAIAGLALAGLALALYFEFINAPLIASALALGILWLAALAWLVAGRAPALGSWLAVGLLVGLALGARVWLNSPLALTLLTLPTALAAALISATAAFGVALAESALLLGILPALGLGLDPTAAALMLLTIWAAAVLVSAAYWHVGQLERWLLGYFESTQRLLEEARSRQAELEQMRDDWVHASRQLALANERLSALRLVAEEARRAKAAFVARVSHEFRTPLNIIIGMVSLMVENPAGYAAGLPERTLEHLQIVYRNCRHLASLIDDVLALSQAEAGRIAIRREKVRLEEVIGSALAVVRPLIEEKGLALLVEAPPEGLPEVHCDRVRIRQVLLNLLSNAARFTDSGSITLSARERDGHVVVSVADTGPGIPAEEAERIFEPFSQAANVPAADRRGSGLGLAISKQFVELHHGRMWLETAPGQGARFSFELPLRPPVPPVARPGHQIVEAWPWVERSSWADPEALRPRPRIVVCHERGALCATLAQQSDEVECVPAAHLDEAARMLRASPAHALIVNAPSPDALWPLLAHASREAPSTPVLGCAFPPKASHARAAGASDYLVKPVTRAALAAALDSVGGPLGRVLVVDDDADTRSLLTLLIRAHDATIAVSTAEDGPTALEAMRAAKPDLVLLDLLMPGIDGWQVLSAMRAEEALREIPVVVVSAQDPADSPARSPILASAAAEGFSPGRLLACARALSAAIAQPD
jgi:signal transduction histidine kinase/CheY-like chemotaxis protein